VYYYDNGVKKNKTYNLQAQYTYNQFIEVGYSAGDVGDFVSWGSYNLQHDTKYF
jgi:hypothetical protein